MAETLSGFFVGGWACDMKKALALLVAFGLAGCDEAEKQVERIWYKGTHIGVQKCVDRNKSDIVSVGSIKKLCIKEHQKPIYVLTAGKAGYKKYGSVKFSGKVINESEKYIITAFDISIEHDDMDDGKRERKSFDGMWIEPGADGSFSISNDELWFKPKIDRFMDGDKYLYSWNIENIKGVKLKVD